MPTDVMKLVQLIMMISGNSSKLTIALVCPESRTASSSKLKLMIKPQNLIVMPQDIWLALNSLHIYSLHETQTLEIYCTFSHMKNN